MGSSWSGQYLEGGGVKDIESKNGSMFSIGKGCRGKRGHPGKKGEVQKAEQKKIVQMKKGVSAGDTRKGGRAVKATTMKRKENFGRGSRRSRT
jgi:hypothetical protein